MRNKRRLYVGIHFRYELSIGEHRRRLGYAAFHWGIIVEPKVSCRRDSYAFDVTNGVNVDPSTMTDLNPNQVWYRRSKLDVDPRNSTHLLGKIMIGKVPNHHGYSHIEAHLRSIPLPERGAVPEQNCVTWLISAIRALQGAGLAEQFDLNSSMVYAIKFADMRMAKGGLAKYANYTTRPV